MHYIIDFSNIRNREDLHATLRDSLGLPEWYGCNFDALADCLTDMYGDIIHIEISGFDRVKKELKDAAATLVEVFGDFKHGENDAHSENIKIYITINGTRLEIDQLSI